MLAGILLSLEPGTAVFADVFTVDTNESSLTLSGTIQALGSAYALTPQGSGSLTTTYSGTIQAAQAAGTIQFTGQSLIQGQNTGAWQPESDGSSGSDTANYGGQVSALGQLVEVALRGILLDVTSPVISVTSGQFDSSSLVFGFSTSGTGLLSYNAGFFGSGAKSLTGYATNNVSALATLATAGVEQTLTIPVNAVFYFSLLSQDDTALNVKGQFVAVRNAVPSLAIQSIGVTNRVVTLQWQSPAGQSFGVMSSPDLTTWQTNASNVSSSTTAYTWSGPATAPKTFYRIAN